MRILVRLGSWGLLLAMAVVHVHYYPVIWTLVAVSSALIIFAHTTRRTYLIHGLLIAGLTIPWFVHLPWPSAIPALIRLCVTILIWGGLWSIILSWHYRQSGAATTADHSPAPTPPTPTD